MTATPEPGSALRSPKQYMTYVSAGPFPYAVAEAPFVRFAFCERQGVPADTATRLKDTAASGT